MDPWYRTITPRQEVREGRSFNPDEFAIALEQVVAGTAPEDYRDPKKFFARTRFTRALTDHICMARAEGTLYTNTTRKIPYGEMVFREGQEGVVPLGNVPAVFVKPSLDALYGSPTGKARRSASCVRFFYEHAP